MQDHASLHEYGWPGVKRDEDAVILVLPHTAVKRKTRRMDKTAGSMGVWKNRFASSVRGSADTPDDQPLSLQGRLDLRRPPRAGVPPRHLPWTARAPPPSRLP